MTLEQPVAGRVDDVLTFVNEGRADVGDMFSERFLAAVPVAQLEALAATQLRPGAPYTVARVVDSTATTAVLELHAAVGGAMRMTIAVGAEPPHLIEGLLFQPVASALASWDDLDEWLRIAAPDVALLAAEVVDGECRPVHAVDPDRVMPLGSAFKLYVLGALADLVAAGEASWDETVAIRDDLRVHTSMTFGRTPAGEEVSLRDLATAMIAVSDNTATDHVMARVGRASVEAAQARLGMADPARNAPFVTTRELTLLKWFLPEAERDAYVAAGRAERERLLAALPADDVTDDAVRSRVIGAPIALDTLEWFASAADLCRAHVGLHGMGEQVRSILRENAGAGLDLDRDRWPSIAFKGGSEPGVLALAWLAERDDGRTFFLGALLRNDAAAIPSTVAVDVAGAFDLLADG